MTIRADSLEYVTGEVIGDHDISADTVEVSVPLTTTNPVTYYPATVLGTVQSVDPVTDTDIWTLTYRVLVGPGAAADITIPANGSYDWTVRVTDDPEIVVMLADTIKVTDGT